MGRRSADKGEKEYALDKRIKAISKGVYHTYREREILKEKERARAMAERRATSEATSGGFMAQVGTNLVAKAQSSAKKVARQLISVASEKSPRRISPVLDRSKDTLADTSREVAKSAEKLKQVLADLDAREDTPPH